ncbi:MAG: glycosyltransferase [Anaerolineales bacterium]
MKIALIASGAIPAHTANSIQSMKMAQAMSDLGDEVRVFAAGEAPRITWGELAAHYGLASEFKIVWLRARPALRRYDFAYAAVGAARAWGAELVYTRLPQAATLAARRGVATIFELHDVPSGTMGPWLLRNFLRAKGARRLVVNTQYLARQIQAGYALPSRKDFLLLAPNGVDLRRYIRLPNPKAARKSLQLVEGFTIGYTGHLYKGRGISFLFELARRLPKMRFLLVGGRPEDVGERRQQARGLKNVLLAGFVPNAELPRYQAACDVLVLPYSRQVSGSSGVDIAPYTNPLKMFEYLATGRPIVASDLPILKEILSEKNAIILPSGDVDAWVEALAGLQRSPRRRAALAKAARQTAGQYTWEKRAQRILRDLDTSAKI